MTTITSFFDQIAATSKRNEKKKILSKMFDEHPFSKKLVKWALDSSVFYITIEEEDIPKVKDISYDNEMILSWWNAFDEICHKLSNRHITGHAAKKLLSDLLVRAPTGDVVRWACRIINKDLEAGISTETVNDVCPGLIDVFEVALAEAYNPDKHPFCESWIAEPKLDGNRVVIFDGIAMSRNGKIYNSFPHIVEKLCKLSHDYLIDGEMMCRGEFDENSGKLRRKDSIADDAYYNVFDLVPIHEWKNKSFTTPLKDRKTSLLDLVRESEFVKVVEWIDLPENPTSKDVFSVRDSFLSQGFEGAVMKDLFAYYTPGRSSSFIKVKKFDPIDGRIVEIQVHRKRRDWLGAFLVECNGVVTKVGSGFSQDQRIQFWKDRSKMIDRMVSLEYQNKTQEGKLRFPTFVELRPDKD